MTGGHASGALYVPEPWQDDRAGRRAEPDEPLPFTDEEPPDELDDGPPVMPNGPTWRTLDQIPDDPPRDLLLGTPSPPSGPWSGSSVALDCAEEHGDRSRMPCRTCGLP